MAVTTDIHPNIAYREKLRECSTSIHTTTLTTELTYPGFRCAIATDTIIRFPIENPGHSHFLMAMFAGCSSVAQYPQIDIQMANPGYPGSREQAHASTVEANWWHYRSTAIQACTATECNAYILGPIDLNRHLCTFGGTSSAITDAWQSFIAVSAGMSTANANATHAALSTGDGSTTVKWIGMFEIPE
jgi:hypothetical protein